MEETAHLFNYQIRWLNSGCWVGYKNAHGHIESTWETGVVQLQKSRKNRYQLFTDGPGQCNIIIDSTVFAGYLRFPIEAMMDLKFPWIQKKEDAGWSSFFLELKQVKDTNISSKHHFRLQAHVHITGTSLSSGWPLILRNSVFCMPGLSLGWFPCHWRKEELLGDEPVRLICNVINHGVKEPISLC